MKKEWIEQFNKKCAEFLKWDYNKQRDRWNKNDFHHEHTHIYTDDLKFHSDWNWIHEILYRIIEIPDGYGYQFKRDIEGFVHKKQAVVDHIDLFLSWYMEKK